MLLKQKKSAPEQKVLPGAKECSREQKKCSWEHLSRALLQSTIISHTIIVSRPRSSPCQSPSDTTANATVPPPHTDRRRYEDEHYRATTLHRPPPIQRRTSQCNHLANHHHHRHCYHTNVETWKGGRGLIRPLSINFNNAGWLGVTAVPEGGKL